MNKQLKLRPCEGDNMNPDEFPKYTIKYTYSQPTYSKYTQRVILTEFLNELHSMQLDMIDEALEKSDLKQANDVIAHIKGKL